MRKQALADPRPYLHSYVVTYSPISCLLGILRPPRLLYSPRAHTARGEYKVESEFTRGVRVRAEFTSVIKLVVCVCSPRAAIAACVSYPGPPSPAAPPRLSASPPRSLSAPPC